MSETPELRVFEFSEEAGGEEDRPATDDEIRAAVVPLLDLEAACDEYRHVDEPHIRAHVRKVVYAALGLGEES